MSFYRTAVFGTKGLLEYTRSGFESASKKFNPEDLNVDLSGQYIMITGANSVNEMTWTDRMKFPSPLFFQRVLEK